MDKMKDFIHRKSSFLSFCGQVCG